jgi:hexosaminidase
MLCTSGLVLLGVSALHAQPTLLPLPAALEPGSGVLSIDQTFAAAPPNLTDPRLLAGIARALARIELATSLPVSRELTPSGRLKIDVQRAGQVVQTPDEDESYTLEVSLEGVQLTAATTVGALRGLETLLQLIQHGPAGPALPVLRVRDSPRFRWRGLLLDVSRHFQPPEVIERTLDGMALVKLNVFHWHLSDDQGFRVESRRFPKLQRLAADARYYTQAQVRALVAYAHARGIRVVPEFDMPGHATSWLVAYPEHASLPGPYTIERRFGIFDPSFDPTRAGTYEFLDAFIGEMKSLLATGNRNANTERKPHLPRKGDDISERLLALGAAVVKLLDPLSQRPGARNLVKHLSHQLDPNGKFLTDHLPAGRCTKRRTCSRDR